MTDTFATEIRTQWLSLGLGRQSTALAILNAEGRIVIPTRNFIFSDTGSERPETYEYLENHFKPYCERMGLNLVIVRRQDYFPAEYNASLEDYSMHYRILPSSMTRWCTDKFKLIPINKRLTDEYPKRETKSGRVLPDYMHHQTVVQVGIAIEEAHRAKPSPIAWQTKRYPLLELKLTTADCLEITKKAGLPPTRKSGCYYCMYMKKSEWRLLRREHPDLAQRAVTIERNARSVKDPTKKKALPMFGSIEQFYTNIDNQPNLPGMGENDVWDDLIDAEAGCVTGHCFL